MNLVLCLTEQCNLRCSYCYYKDTQSARHNVMDDETLEQAIRVGLERSLFFKQSYLNITFFGGEPLLRKDAIFKGVNMAKAFLAEAMDKGEATLSSILQSTRTARSLTTLSLIIASESIFAFTCRSTVRNTTTTLRAVP